MAQLKHEIKVSITEIEPIRHLLTALRDHFENLPLVVQQLLIEPLSHNKTVWDLDFFVKMGIPGPDIDVYLDGVKTSGVISIWPDTYEVVVWGKGVSQHKDIQVRNSKTGERICGVPNDHA